MSEEFIGAGWPFRSGPTQRARSPWSHMTERSKRASGSSSARRRRAADAAGIRMRDP